MSRLPRVVVDASALSKLYCREPGQVTMRALLGMHAEGSVVMSVDHLCVCEVLRTVWRKFGLAEAREAFDALRRYDLALHPPSPALVEAAFDQSEALGCDLYDGFSAGLAALLEAPLYSADRKAHAAFPGVVLVDTDEAPHALPGAPATPR